MELEGPFGGEEADEWVCDGVVEDPPGEAAWFWGDGLCPCGVMVVEPIGGEVVDVSCGASGGEREEWVDDAVMEEPQGGVSESWEGPAIFLEAWDPCLVAGGGTGGILALFVFLPVRLDVFVGEHGVRGTPDLRCIHQRHGEQAEAHEAGGA